MPDKEWIEPRLPEKEIAKLTREIFKGETFTSWNIVGESMDRILLMVFLPLRFMNDELVGQFEAHPPSMICAHMADALPRSTNGYPTFTTMKLVYAQDAKLIWEKLKKLDTMEKEILEVEE